VGSYDELDTGQLEWVVLDRLVPPDDESAARKALIARNPELRSLVLRGMLSEEEAVELLRTRQSRYASGAGAWQWVRWAITVAGGAAAATLVFHLAR